MGCFQYQRQGNIMHCVARSSISHCFSGRLIEGEIYTINNFTVVPNRDSYRVRPDDKYIIQLEGNNTVKRNERISGDFLRYPFSLVPIEEVELNGSKFLIDVFGVAINMGKVKATRNGSQMMQFHLLNERGRGIKATLWGSICDGLIKMSVAAVPPLIVILTGMNVREFKNDIYLSSTSATTIYDNPDIHAISSLRKIIGEPNVNVVSKAVKDIKSKVCTLSQLLDIGRSNKALKQKDSVTIQCGVEIVDIRQKNSWHYFSCGKGNCKKGLSRTGGHFWCGACESQCEFPVVRYRIHMDVTDGTTSLVLTMFDDLAELLIRKKASTVMEELGVAVVDCVVPNDIMMLIGTKHTFEIKSHTYYNHGLYESFTISDIVGGTSVLEEGLKGTVNTREADGVIGLDKSTEKATQPGDIENIDESTLDMRRNTVSSFYRILNDATVVDKMPLPEQFTVAMGIAMGWHMHIRVPDGQTFHVRLQEDNGQLVLKAGWSSFLAYYTVRMGYMIWFKQENITHYDVRIYDLTTSEVSYRRRCMITLFRHGTAADGGIANLSVPEIQFQVKLSKSYINPPYCVYIRGTEVKAYLRATPLKSIIIYMHGKQWEVELSKKKRGIYLNSGWDKVVVDNELPLDYVCTFQLLNEEHLCFKMTVAPPN